MKTIGQIIHSKNFYLLMVDSSGNKSYFENSSGYWVEREHDSNNKEIHFITSSGFEYN